MIERQYLAHFIDASMGVGATRLYVRIGKDLEEYNEELNPDIETSKNILGENSVKHNGYEVQSTVEPYYAEAGDMLYQAVEDIALRRKTGDACKTTKVDVLFSEDGDIIWAWKEDVKLIPTAIGGDTSGYQIPFEVHNCGNRIEVTDSFTAPSMNLVYESATLTSAGFKSGVTYYTRTGSGTAQSPYEYAKVEGSYTTGTTYYTRKISPAVEA